MAIVVPISRGFGGGMAPMQDPGEANLLMALAEMHRQGRIPSPAPAPKSAKPDLFSTKGTR